MSILDMHRRELARLMEQEAALHRDRDRHAQEAAKAEAECRRQQAAAQRTSSPSLRNSYLNAAERARDKAISASSRATAVNARIAANARAQAGKRRQVETSETAQRRTDEREAEKRRSREKSHARELARLSAPVVRYIHVRAPEPEKLRVLYMTANPRLDLRLEQEVRQVQQALRGAKYRDLVDVALRPAATFQDLLDALNDRRPHIVHFSGHGGGEAVAFHDGSLEEPDHQHVGFALLMEALAATDTPPSLLVLNACDTLEGVEAILPAVPVIVGMSDDVLDTAAIIFAQQFYAAIAGGQSVGSALRQAKVKIKAALADEEASSLPQHVAREDVDIDALVLVQAASAGTG